MTKEINQQTGWRNSLWFVPIISLGFATTSLTWSIFNIAVPVFLQNVYAVPLFLTGFIMTWDNIIAFFVQPYIGTLSDRTRTRFGKRMPYIIVGIVFASFFFILIPNALVYPIFVFLLVIVLFNLSMALYRSPSVSLMPDFISSQKRSLGNGIVNLMGGIYGAIALFVVRPLFKAGKVIDAFGLIVVMMLISLVIMLIFIREPKTESKKIEIETDSAFNQLVTQSKLMFRTKDKSLLFMLLAIFSWFIAWNAIESFFSTYIWKVFLPLEHPNVPLKDLSDLALSDSAGIIFVFPVIFVVFTLIGGFIGQKYGRIPTMKVGLIIFLFAITSAIFVNLNSWFGLTINWRTSFQILFSVAAMGWGLVNVNSIVVVWEHAVDNGTGTGVYYAFASAAAILGPASAGFILDFNLSYFFIFSIVFIIISFIFLLFVKSGESGDGDALEAVELVMD